ncbi:uncharacterized protein GMORB2_7244 [Geosmithia morbida]|uniref:Uncharacterized protein n=1 Tax=Geosmithia morbida TaxID=1094350 RepID=A0A9P5D117_9HYPO|nr:uncharacterized protein GMORB2_7244 [Geosmithia morbida]KAF4122252.1 uncharacterized protein GMORB2_7244 [Geosmithia morbida]
MPDITFPFIVSAFPGTDLWRKPPSTDDKNAPIKTHTKAPLTSLLSATVTFSTVYTTQFDQAGLVLTITNPVTGARKWIKAGVEFFDDQPRLSIVCCDNWSDWSVAPLDGRVSGAVKLGEKAVTVRLQRNGETVWVYYIDDEGRRVPLREIAWVYGDSGGEGWEVEVGAVVARPNKDVKGELEATFHSLNVELQQ